MFLQLLIVLIGIAALALMLWEPHLEGRNAHATAVLEIYFHDPFLAYAYLSSIAFFIALFQTFKLVGYIGEDKISSPDAVRSLRTIRYCAIVLVATIAAAVVYLFVAVRGKDDIAGGVAMGLFMILVSIVVGSVALVLERRLHAQGVGGREKLTANS